MTKSYTIIVFLLTAAICNSEAQSFARNFRGLVAIEQPDSEPAVKLIVDPPLPVELATGKVVIQYRTENLRIVPVYGYAAVNVSPRIGHLHITVDDLPWHWADASNEPIILVGLPPGPHSVRIGLADANHHVIQSQRISFIVPATNESHKTHN